MDYPDAFLRNALAGARVIALVGASANPARPSHYVGKFLRRKGYRVIGVNPGLAGQELYGEKVYASLSDIPVDFDVDFVDIFRQPGAVPAIVDEALAHLPKLQVIWMQLGINSPEAAARAEAKGMQVVQDRCPMVEHPRLIG